MVRKVIVIGPMGDSNLTRLHPLLGGMLPQGSVSGMPEGCSRADLPDMMMRNIIEEIMPPGMFGDMSREQHPQGVSIKIIRGMHDSDGGQMRRDGRFLTGDDFPVNGNPLDSLLSLLYSSAQPTTMLPEIKDGVVEEVGKDLGSEVTSKVLSFIDEARAGKLVLKDGDKEIEVTISNSNDDPSEVLVDEVTDKVASLIGTDFTLSALEKKAAATAFSRRRLTNRDLKKVGLVHTDLVALKKQVDALSSILEDGGGDLEALAGGIGGLITKDGCVTSNNSDQQGAIREALLKILDTKDGADTTNIDDMVYNTEMPVTQEVVIQIAGYPVDVSKMRSMTKREALSRYTPSLANYIYDEDKGSVTQEKIEQFMNILESIKKDKPEMAEMFFDRLVTPLFEDLAPDESDLCEGTIEETE